MSYSTTFTGRLATLFHLSTETGGAEERLQRRAMFLAEAILDSHEELLSLLRSAEKEDPLFIFPAIRWLERGLSVKRFQAPVGSRRAEGYIRETMQMSSDVVVTTRHVQLAVLSACLTPLRQQIGSCFATAPAILIQQEEPERLLDDLYELLATGSLSRTIEGVTYAVPLALSWGRSAPLFKELEHWENTQARIGAVGIPDARLRRMKAARDEQIRIDSAKRRETSHPLLRAWEYTLASFCDVKTEFSSWNLYKSLGLHPSEPGGLGALIYDHFQAKLDKANLQVEDYHAEYTAAFDQLRATELLLKQAGSEREIRRLQAEHASRLYHMRTCLEMRDTAYDKANKMSTLPSQTIQYIQEKIPQYFQEIYDPELHEAAAELLEDSPAGFRLIYKHGRTDPSLWTPIRSAEEYSDALISFFIAIEKEELSGLTQAIIDHLRSPPKGAPWAYISGGTLSTLLKVYYRKDFSTEVIRAENPIELLTFLIETFKSIPHFRPLLVSSEEHAFILHPEWFKEAIESPKHSYTWVRDHLDKPLLIGDSNWPYWFFGFASDPELALYRFTPSLTERHLIPWPYPTTWTIYT